MNETINHETLRRGTPDFQIELYDVTKEHPRYNMQYHWHNKYEIVYVRRGELVLSLNGKKLTVCEGQAVFIPCGVVHGGIPCDCEYVCVVFSPSMLHSTQRSRLIMKTQFNSPVTHSGDALLEGLIRDLVEKPDGYELAVTGKLYLFVYSILGAGGRTGLPLNTGFEKIKPALSYIEENYFGKIKLDTLASECGMSTNYFCRFFKMTASETPSEYITRYRIEMACEFLLSGMTVTETAYASGFNDTSYFINVFKKYMGCSPKKYIQHSSAEG